MNKRDRQGVRTPANLEQKYDFGAFQKEQEAFNKSLGGKVERQESSFKAFAKQVEEWIASLTQSIEKLWKSVNTISDKQNSTGTSLSSLADNVEALLKWKKEVESEAGGDSVPSELLVNAYADDFDFKGVTVDKSFAEIESAIKSDTNVRVKARNLTSGQYAFLSLASYLEGKSIEFIGFVNGIQIALRQGLTVLKGAFGSSITLSDSSSEPLQGLIIYGKTTQNGTPAPDAPVALVSPGDSGSITVSVDDQNLVVSTPNGLPGKPVDSGGNYIDENGQQWLCDEVDFVRGVYVQRLFKTVWTGTETIQVGGATAGGKRFSITQYMAIIKPAPTAKIVANILCSHFKPVSAEDTYFAKAGVSVDDSGRVYIYFPEIEQTAAAMKAFLASSHTTFITELATPVETPLSAEELAAYAALHTNCPSTTIYADGAEMEVKYMAFYN